MGNEEESIEEFFDKFKCCNCSRWTKPRKESACHMEQDNPDHIPINDYIANGNEFYCADFKEK